jgi:hypothetical protein
MKINLDHNEFLDFICIMLYDILKNDDYLNNNERFNKLVEDMDKKGLTQLLFRYYLNAPADMRKEYKTRFKSVLKDNSKQAGTLFVYPVFKEKE